MAKRLNSGKSKTTNIGAFRIVGNNGVGGDDEYAEPNQVADTLTDAQTKTKYESNSNTNAFTDADVTKLSTVESNAEVQDLTINTEKTGNFTTSTSISNSQTDCNSGSGIQATITDAACITGKILMFTQTGAGVVTFVADGGVTLRTNVSGTLETTGQGDNVVFLKVASNIYQMI